MKNGKIVLPNRIATMDEVNQRVCELEQLGYDCEVVVSNHETSIFYVQNLQQ